MVSALKHYRLEGFSVERLMGLRAGRLTERGAAGTAPEGVGHSSSP